MITFSRELTVPWGESDPFGLVYFPRMLAWFNDTEHDLLRALGYPTDKLISERRTAFVMGDIHFRFIGPAAYGDRITTIIQLAEIGKSTLHWDCKAVLTSTGATVTEGRAIRIHAQIQEDGTLKAMPIPEDLRNVLSQSGSLIETKPKNAAVMLDE